MLHLDESIDGALVSYEVNDFSVMWRNAELLIGTKWRTVGGRVGRGRLCWTAIVI